MQIKGIFSGVLLVGILQGCYADSVSVSGIGGIIWPKLKNESLVQINSVQSNRYVTDQMRRTKALYGGRVSRMHVGLVGRDFDLDAGVLGLYTKYGKVEGTEHPFSNAGNFDTLQYQFKVSSIGLLLNPRLMYVRWPLQPYVDVGLGISFNRAYGYDEVPTDSGGGAAPVPNGFASRTRSCFAYMAGAGLQLLVLPGRVSHLFLGAEYGWMDMGEAKLGKMPPQTASPRLRVKSLGTQYVFLSLEYRHGV